MRREEQGVSAMPERLAWRRNALIYYAPCGRAFHAPNQAHAACAHPHDARHGRHRRRVPPADGLVELGGETEHSTVQRAREGWPACREKSKV